MASQVDRIDGLVGSIAVKAPCKVATTANITLSGAQTIDGVALTADETPRQRVLVKDQTDDTENGIYDVNSGAWTRSPDFDGDRDAVTGTQVVISEGTVSAGYTYRLTSTNPVSIGTDSLTFVTSASTALAAQAAAEAAQAAAELAETNAETAETNAETAETNAAASAAAAAADASSIQGDGTLGRVMRVSSLAIGDAGDDGDLDCALSSEWNGDAIGSTADITKGNTVGDFYLTSGGNGLLILNAGLTGDAVAVLSAVIVENRTGTAILVRPSGS